MLASEPDRVRAISLASGERLSFHYDVPNYFWTAVTDGRASSRHEDGSADDTVYRTGDTRHLSSGPG